MNKVIWTWKKEDWHNVELFCSEGGETPQYERSIRGELGQNTVYAQMICDENNRLQIGRSDPF